MRIYQFILFTIIISLIGCNKKNASPVKHIDELDSRTHIYNINENCSENNDLNHKSAQQLLAINRRITTEVRENYRSWSYDEPDRWKYLADKFSEEVICAYPESWSKQKEVANLYLSHLKQRASIYKSDSKNKQALMGNSVTEFIYELKFLIGVEGFQKWETLSKLEIQNYKNKRDSLTHIISSQQKNANKKL